MKINIVDSVSFKMIETRTYDIVPQIESMINLSLNEDNPNQFYRVKDLLISPTIQTVLDLFPRIDNHTPFCDVILFVEEIYFKLPES